MEIAGVLAYLYFETSMPIIHRDIKIANILLDDNFTTKLSDYGASKPVPLCQTQFTILVEGTPELLTNKMTLCFDMPESDQNLAMNFVFVVNFQILVEHIVNEGNIEHLKEVSNLAKWWLNMKGDDRPFMKEAAIKLKGLVFVGNVNVRTDETNYLISSPIESFNIDDSTSGFANIIFEWWNYG
ncbi:wall-associated receptor kinase 3-like [Quercus suber]|uniref:wall-associated receptor kinase 3-like n=1 Tax=Quercus suber TaxID=58331 RepID=UPI0032DF04B7